MLLVVALCVVSVQCVCNMYFVVETVVMVQSTCDYYWKGDYNYVSSGGGFFNIFKKQFFSWPLIASNGFFLADPKVSGSYFAE